MRRPPRILPVITLVVILVMAAFPPATAMTRREHRLLRLVNDLRARHGLVRLNEDPDVTKDARRHSARMVRAGTLYHTVDLKSVVGRSASAWGENVAKARRVHRIFTMWVNSSGHRANLLSNRYRRCGVGIVRSHGYLWATMIFYG
jgi:uncharacterized protein YkwD